MTTFWLGAVALTLVAVGMLIVPLVRERLRSRRVGVSGWAVVIAIAPVAIALHLAETNFDAMKFDGESVPGAASEEMELLEQLAARLANDPDDVDGWVLLGRSFIQLNDYESARQALEEAWKRTAEPDDILKLAYARTLLFTEEGAALTLAGDLVEDVLQSSPSNSEALLWGGFVAMDRNQPVVAVERFSALLATNPPPEIADMLRTQILAISGGAPAAVATPSVSPAANTGPVIELEVELAEELALEDFGPNAALFILARAAGSRMPVSVARLPVSSLPGRFSLSDANAMAGQSLSQHDQVTVVARISRSGTATEQPGDAFDQTEYDLDTGGLVSLTIDKLVPEG